MLGPDRIAVVFRGTNNLYNVMRDFQVGLTPFPSKLGRKKKVGTRPQALVPTTRTHQNAAMAHLRGLMSPSLSTGLSFCYLSMLLRSPQAKVHVGFLKTYAAVRMSVFSAVANLYRDSEIAAKKPLVITVCARR